MVQFSAAFDRLPHILADYGAVQRPAWQCFWNRCHIGSSRANGGEFPQVNYLDVRS